MKILVLLCIRSEELCIFFGLSLWRGIFKSIKITDYPQMMEIFNLIRRLVIITDLSLRIYSFRLIIKFQVIWFLEIRRLKVYFTKFFVSGRYHSCILSEKITQWLRRFFDSKICGLFIKVLNLALKLLINPITHTWSRWYRWDDIGDCYSWALYLTHGNADMHSLWRLHFLNLVCRLYSFLTCRCLFVNNYCVVSTPCKWLIFAVSLLLLLSLHLVHDVEFNILSVYL